MEKDLSDLCDFEMVERLNRFNDQVRSNMQVCGLVHEDIPPLIFDLFADVHNDNKYNVTREEITTEIGSVIACYKVNPLDIVNNVNRYWGGDSLKGDMKDKLERILRVSAVATLLTCCNVYSKQNLKNIFTMTQDYFIFLES